MPRPHRRDQGIALMTVVLILLVLTVLGMTATMMMTQEDRLSSRLQYQKQAFYAAEAGLRHGESRCSTESFTADNLTRLLRGPTTTPPACPATAPGVPVHPASGRDPGLWTTGTLGAYLTDALGVVANREVVLASVSGIGGGVRAYYSVYIRNNPEDAGNIRFSGPPLNIDPDNRLRIVVVGFLTDGNGVDGAGNANVLAVRILEEELAWSSGIGERGTQKGKDQGNTGSGRWSGEDVALPNP